MIHHKRQSSMRNGSITVLILIFSIVLMLLGVATLRVSMHERLFAIRSAHVIASKTAADAGLDLVTHRFKNMLETGSVDLSLLQLSGEPVLNSDATFDCKVSSDSPSTYHLESTGHSQSVARTVRATFKLKGLYDHAILTKGKQILKAGVLIDGYNSMDATKTDVEVKIATTSILADQIILNSGSVVDGEVIVGVGGDPVTVIDDHGGTTGDRYAMTEEPPFPVITPPALPSMGSLLVKAATHTLTPADNGQYTSLTAELGSSAGIYAVTGGDVVLHITGDISLGSDCEITIAAGSSLTLYVDGDITCGTSSGIGYLDPAKNTRYVTIYGTAPVSQSFDVKAKTYFTGTIYAPKAHIGLNAQGDIYGSFVGNTLEYKANGDFFYDEDLRNVSLTDLGASLALDRWSE